MLFSELSKYFQKLEQTASRNEMTVILSDLFKKASSSEIGEICYLLQGRVAPLYEAIEFGIADKLMIRAIASAYKIPDSDVLKRFKKHGDLGITGEEVSSIKYQVSRGEMFSSFILHPLGSEQGYFDT